MLYAYEGSGSYGRLGLGHSKDVPKPTKVGGLLSGREVYRWVLLRLHFICKRAMCTMNLYAKRSLPENAAYLRVGITHCARLDLVTYSYSGLL